MDARSKLQQLLTLARALVDATIASLKDRASELAAVEASVGDVLAVIDADIAAKMTAADETRHEADGVLDAAREQAKHTVEQVLLECVKAQEDAQRRLLQTNEAIVAAEKLLGDVEGRLTGKTAELRRAEENVKLLSTRRYQLQGELSALIKKFGT
jgi:hypothetical protein